MTPFYSIIHITHRESEKCGDKKQQHYDAVIIMLLLVIFCLVCWMLQKRRKFFESTCKLFLTRIMYRFDWHALHTKHELIMIIWWPSKLMCCSRFDEIESMFDSEGLTKALKFIFFYLNWNDFKCLTHNKDVDCWYDCVFKWNEKKNGLVIWNDTIDHKTLQLRLY